MQKFTEHIFEFEKKYLGYRALSSAIRCLVAILVIWVSAALADHVFYFSEITRWGLWFVNIGATAYLAYRFLFKPLRDYGKLGKESDLSQAARRITAYFPEVGDDLINAYQLLRTAQQKGESQELREAAVRQILKKYEHYRFADRIRFMSMLPEWRWLLYLMLGVGFLIAFRGTDIWHSTRRLLNPANPYLNVPPFSFTIDPGDTTLIKGDAFNIKVFYHGPSLKKCYLVLNGQTGRQKIELTGGSTKYSGQLKNILQPFEYQVMGEPLIVKDLEKYLKSKVFRVQVVTLPVVRTLDLTLFPPQYTGLPSVKAERNIGDVSALEGTMVKVRVASNTPLATAKIAFSWQDTLMLNVRRQIATGQFILKKEGNYKILLRDTSGYENRNPIVYQLTILKDYPPLVEITDPGKDLEMPLDAQLPVTAEARDDFGISRMFLKYRIIKPHVTGDSTWQRAAFALQKSGGRQQTGRFVFDFNTLPLAFGDRLTYFAMAADNNYLNGPGFGKSRVYVVQFPSIDEIFKAADQTQQEKAEDLKNVTQDARELNKTLKRLDRELKQSRKLDWDKKSQITKALERQKKLQKKVEQIRKELQDVVQKLEKNNLLSEDVLKKYMQVQKLLQDVITPELQKALEKLHKKMEKAARPEDVEKALKDFTLNQEAFEKSIERTMELLKQVQFEQKMDELVKKAENLFKQQKKMSAQLKKSDSLKAGDKANLQQMQKKQKDQFERLKFDLQQMQKNPLLAKYPKTAQMLDSIKQQMSEPNLQKQMQQMQRQLSQENYRQAMKQSAQLQKKFGQISQSLQQAYRQMLNQGKQQIARQMQRAMRRLLQLSKQQENVYKKTKGTSPLSQKFNQVIRDQGQLNSNLNKIISEIVQLSKQTFLIQPQMSQSLQSAAQNMRQALQQLSDRYKSGGMRYQMQAMGALNRGVGQMMQAQKQLGSSKSGTGFEQFMQQLQQMAGKQGQLNKQTMDLFNTGKNGSFSMQQQQEMRRIAAEQAALRQALQKLNEKMGERENRLGRLGKVAQDMDKVVKDLLKQNLNRKTIQRQQQILSRMLDAQKSIRQREYSKKRQAIRAKKYLAHDPGTLANPYDMSLKQLQDAMHRAMEQGYNRDYQILIEAYFKRLMRDYQKNNRQ